MNSAVRLRVGLIAAAVSVLTAGSAPGAAHAGAWQSAEFTSPGGKPARGLATDAVGTPGARLAIGCAGEAKDAWRGIAVWRDAATGTDAAEVEVVVSFFGRTPVTERWQRRADGSGRVVVWPRTSENLRRNLMREDTTRAQASVTIEIREPGVPVAKLVFGVDGLAERAHELGAACGGWGAESSYKRRERGW